MATSSPREFKVRLFFGNEVPAQLDPAEFKTWPEKVEEGEGWKSVLATHTMDAVITMLKQRPRGSIRELIDRKVRVFVVDSATPRWPTGVPQITRSIDLIVGGALDEFYRKNPGG